MPDSSPDTEIAETPVSAEAPQTEVSDVNTRESSAGDAAGKSMIDAVKAALDQKAGSPSAEAPGESAKDDSKAPDPDGEAKDDDELSEEELKGLHEKTHRRLRGLISKVKAKDEEIASLRPKAEEFDKIEGAIKQSGLHNEEVGELLTIGALLKRGDVKAAYERMAPTFRAIEQALGLSGGLPADLQQKVDQGYITEADARELVKARADAAIANRKVEMTEAERAQERQRQEIDSLVASTTKAIGEWEAKKAASDPDWHLKRKEVADLVELSITREARKTGKPYFPNAKEAIELSEAALKTINDRFRKFGVRPVEIKPVTTAGASTRSQPAPKSILDVVRQTVAAGAAT